MLKFCSLYSGSTGNSLLVQTENTNILIDAGVSTRKIEVALRELSISPDNISAILITHEHSDHVQSVGNLSKKYNIPVFSNEETWIALSDEHKSKIAESNVNFYVANEKFEIDDLEIYPFSIPHDAVDPCGFSVFADNKKVSVATDIGHVEESLITTLIGSDILLIESNYDNDTLLCGSYPYFLKRRILGDLGHLSNDATSKLVRRLYENGVNKFILGHLSKENNFPELAYQAVYNELSSSNVKTPFTLSIAKRDSIDDVVELV